MFKLINNSVCGRERRRLRGVADKVTRETHGDAIPSTGNLRAIGIRTAKKKSTATDVDRDVWISFAAVTLALR